MRFPETELGGKYREDGKGFEDEGSDGLKMLLSIWWNLSAHGSWLNSISLLFKSAHLNLKTKISIPLKKIIRIISIIVRLGDLDIFDQNNETNLNTKYVLAALIINQYVANLSSNRKA